MPRLWVEMNRKSCYNLDISQLFVRVYVNEYLHEKGV